MGPGPEPVLGQGPVLVISGPDDYSRSLSRFNFGPGTSRGPGPSPVTWLLKYLY